MEQTRIIERIAEICREFDGRVEDVGITFARVELAKALAEAEAENARLTAEVEAAANYIVDLTHPLNSILPASNSRTAYQQARAARVQAAAPGTGEAHDKEKSK